jgi:hypothetical protein
MIFAVFLLACIAAKAQRTGFSIRVTVEDSLNGQYLENATVSLLRVPEGTTVYQRRIEKRDLVFSNLPSGGYQLVTSFLGYATDTLSITFPRQRAGQLMPADNVKNVRVLLHHSAKDLVQVIVKAEIPPGTVKNDTIAFNSAAFPTRPNATVEGLLRKIPGIEIDKDGNVTLQGRNVDKIYLDGKEFYLNDPRIATQNLPASIVDQIEIFDSQTERARLTGVRETAGNKSINIKLKKNSRNSAIGTVYSGTGAGTSESTLASSYSVGGTVTSLANSWLFATANHNNINNQFAGTDNANGLGSGGLQTFNNASVNFRNEKDSKLAVTVNAGTNGVKTSLIQATQLQTYLTDSSLLQNSRGNTNSRTQSYFANTYLEYNYDSLSLIAVRSAWAPKTSASTSTDSAGVTTLKGASGYLSNQAITGNSSHTDGYTLTNLLDFRRLWRQPGRSLFISLTQSGQHQDQPQNIYNQVNTFDSIGLPVSQTLTNQISSQLSKDETYGVSASYTQPLQLDHLIDFNYSLNRVGSYSNRQSYDFDSATGKFDFPDSLTTSHFAAFNTIQRFSVGYNGKDSKYRYQFGIIFQLSDLENRNRTTGNAISHNQLIWYPSASLLYTPEKGKNFSFIYSVTTTNPTIQQLQPIPDLTNPLLVQLGNPALLQQLTHRLFASYNSFNNQNFQNLQLLLQGNYLQHEITADNTVLSGGIQQVQYVNVDGVWNVNSTVTYGFALGRQHKDNSSLSLYIQYNHNVSLTNGTQDITKGFVWGGSWKLNYHPLENLFLESTAALTYTGAFYSINVAQNAQTWVQNYSADVSYEFPGFITLASHLNLQITGRQAGLPAKTVNLWNASIFKDFLHGRRGQIRLSAFSILNTSSDYTQSVGVNYLQTQQSNLPGRILLLSFIYHFKSNGGGTQP